MIVQFDTLNRFVVPRVTLCNPCSRYDENKKIVDYSIGVLNNLKNFTMNYNFNAQSTGSFEYTDLTNTVDEKDRLYYKEIYSKLQEYRYLFIQDFGFCIITSVDETETIVNGKKTLVKQVEFTSCDKELENYEVPIFTTEDIDTVTMTLSEVFDEITNTYSNWTIGDYFLKQGFDRNNTYRTFRDISAENLYDFMFGTEGSIEDAFDCIIDCDYINRKFNIYSKETYIEKHSTNIILSDNLLKDLSYNSTSEDLYSALSIEGDNELNIRAVNPNGTNIIYNFDHFKSEGWLPDDLIEKINILENNIKMVNEDFYDYANYEDFRNNKKTNYHGLYYQLCSQFEIAQREYLNLVEEKEALEQKYKSKTQAYQNICNSDNAEKYQIEKAKEEVDKILEGSFDSFDEIINYIVPIEDEEWINEWKNGTKYQDEICFVKSISDINTSTSSSGENVTLKGINQIISLYKFVTPNTYQTNFKGEKLYYLDDSTINWNRIYFYFNPLTNSGQYDETNKLNNRSGFFNATKADLKAYLTPLTSDGEDNLRLNHYYYIGATTTREEASGTGYTYFSPYFTKNVSSDGRKNLTTVNLELYKLNLGLKYYGENPLNKTDTKFDDNWESKDYLNSMIKWGETNAVKNGLPKFCYNTIDFKKNNTSIEKIGLMTYTNDYWFWGNNVYSYAYTYRYYLYNPDLSSANPNNDGNSYLRFRQPVISLTGKHIHPYCNKYYPLCVDIKSLYTGESVGWGGTYLKDSTDFPKQDLGIFYPIRYRILINNIKGTITSPSGFSKGTIITPYEFNNQDIIIKSGNTMPSYRGIYNYYKYQYNIDYNFCLGMKYIHLKKSIEKINELCSIGTKVKKINNIYFEPVIVQYGNNSYIYYELVIETEDTPIFTEDDIKRLYSYIKVGTYSNTDLTVTTNMTDEEKIEQAEILLQKGKDKLKDISENLKKISVTPKDFIFNKEFVSYTAQLNSGATIKIKPEKVLSDENADMLEEYYLSNFSVNYEDKTLSMTFGNKLNRFDLKSLFDDVLGDVSKSAFQIRKIKQKLD